MKEAVHKAFKHTLSNKNEFKKEVIEALMTLDSNNCGDESSAKCGDFAKFLVNEIQKYELDLAGKKKLIRFSPRVLRMCMSLWLRSPAGYKEIQDANLQVRQTQILVSYEWCKIDKELI